MTRWHSIATVAVSVLGVAVLLLSPSLSDARFAALCVLVAFAFTTVWIRDGLAFLRARLKAAPRQSKAWRPVVEIVQPHPPAQISVPLVIDGMARQAELITGNTAAALDDCFAAYQIAKTNGGTLTRASWRAENARYTMTTRFLAMHGVIRRVGKVWRWQLTAREFFEWTQAIAWQAGLTPTLTRANGRSIDDEVFPS